MRPERKIIHRRKEEQGQTIILVALSLFALLSMAALAIDVTTLYVADMEAQQAADAAALAGAKVFVTSGYTSYPSGFGNTSWVCNGSNGLADYAAQSALAANTVAGAVPTMTTSCNFTNPENPTITVRVQRSALPIFFARIWGAISPSASARATAEAYNPSGGSVPIQTGIVKPFLLPNCPPNSSSNPNTPCTPFYVDPTTGAVVNSATYLGQPPFTFTLPSQSSAPNGLPGQFFFYPIDYPTYPPIAACPVSPISSCNGQTGNSPYYFDNIFCSNPNQLKCGDLVGGLTNNPVDTRLNGTNWNALQSRLDHATQCLIHTSAANNVTGTCTTGAFEQDCFIPQGVGQPTLIVPGSENPDALLLAAGYISRSDAVVTVPLFDGRNLCAGATTSSPTCNYNAPIVGFLQLGIVQDLGGGSFQAVVLNISGCTGSGQAVTGGSIASIPVRLVQNP